MQYDPKPINDVHKIAVLRANALGDYIFALPALQALRAAYPQTEIVYLGREWHKYFLEGRPGPIDRVVVVPTARGVNGPPGQEERIEGDPQELDRFFEEQSAEHYDLVLQMHGGGRFSNPFVKRLGARITAGLRAPEAEKLDRWAPYRYFQPEILRYLEVVQLVGARPVSLVPHLAPTQQDLNESCAAVPVEGAALVVLHPGAGDPTRCWPPEKFGEVARGMAEAGYRVVITGTLPERETTQAVVDSAQVEVMNLTGELTLGGLAGLLSRASLVISNDSGPLHLAEAVGAQTVGIYWCGNLINAEPITRSRHRALLSWRLDCPICGRNTISDACKHQVSFVADVPVQEVLAEAFDLLGKPDLGDLPHQ